MIISEKTLNKDYLKFCKLRSIDPLKEESTKLFMRAWMKRRKLSKVRKEGTNYHFK